MDCKEVFRSAITYGGGGEVALGWKMRRPRMHQNGPHKDRQKGILNVCRLLLLAHTFSDLCVCWQHR